MKKLIKSVIITVALTTTSLFAGGGHSHDANGGHHYQAPVSKTVAKEKAIKVINSFLKKDVIDKSWSGIEADSVQTKVIHGVKEWVITFKNDKIEDKKKQKLYVFLTISGRYIAANYTGK